jgi:class 3 adenylate cyclase/tetratricopeptide (TPR) repeat protein
MADSFAQSPQIPEEYAAKLRQARASRAMEGERRVLTLLFCDVTGSTAMAEQLDPEEWAEIMNEAFHYMIAPIYTYEGTVTRLMGDAVLALFGAPIAHEDDPQRAILAGLDIVTGIEKFAAQIKQTYGMDFNVRVGINTGPVVVGEIGPDLAVEYTALGDAVNLAARMEQTAQPGTVQIAANTFHLVAPFFDITPLGELEVKGKDEPVRAYQVEGITAQPGSLRGIEGLESPMVGRDAELAALRRIVGLLHETGRGHVVFLIGEAGLGKSRLIDELRVSWQATPNLTENGWDHWEEVAAASFETKRPFGMTKRRLLTRNQITAADSPQIARDKLAKITSRYPPDLQERLNQLLAILLGIGAEEPGSQPEGEDFKRALFEATREEMRIRAAGLPTVMVAEDIHWADQASIEELEDLMQLARENPILFIAIMRPEQDSAAWLMMEHVTDQLGEQVTKIKLHPLNDHESATMVDNLLPVRDLPPSLRDRILQRSDGNPFFIEEVIRALLDSGALQQKEGSLLWNPQQSPAEVPIPNNVQALLAARIDSLEKGTRHTLQLASVIGRNFYRRILEKISETATNLDEQLDVLQTLALIRVAAQKPELEYTFRHTLTRDAAYATILHRQRRQYHKKVGEAFETLFPDRLEEEAHRLAEHFHEALILDKAQHYYTMAGDQAMRLSANMEAANHYANALALAKDVGTEDQLLRLYQRLGRNFELSGRYDDALKVYQEMQDMSAERNIPQLKLHALLAEVTIRSTYTDKTDARLASQLAYEALSLAQELGDSRAESRAYWNLSLLGTYTNGDAQQTIEFGEKAAAIARENKLSEELAFALHDLARPYIMNGRVADSENALEEAAKIWRELGRYNMLADNRTSLSEFLALQGKLDQALALAKEGLQISRQSRNNWGIAYALGTLGQVLMEIGEVDRALASWEECLAAARQANFTAPQVLIRAYMAFSYSFLGDFDHAFQLFDEIQSKLVELNLSAFRMIGELGVAQLNLLTGNKEVALQTLPEIEDRLKLARSEPIVFELFINTQIMLKLERGQYEAALDEVVDALDLVDKSKLALFKPELKLFKANALTGLDRLEEAVDQLQAAASLARSFNAKTDLLPILARQIEVEEMLGHSTAVGIVLKEGQDLIGFFQQHISNPDLRHKFLKTDNVQILSKNT